MECGPCELVCHNPKQNLKPSDQTNENGLVRMDTLFAVTGMESNP